MADRFNPGDDIRLYATLTDSAGDATDPTAMVLIVTKPNETQVGYKTSTGWADQGSWDADENDPTLADGTGTGGHYYTVTVAGSVDFGNGSITFAVGDQVFYNGAAWRKIPSPSATTLTKDGTGNYYVYQYVSQIGDWKVTGESVGARAGDVAYFGVRE